MDVNIVPTNLSNHIHFFTTSKIKCRSNVLTYETRLGGAKHGDWTILIIIPVTSASRWQAGWHVEIRANVSAYANTKEKLTEEELTRLKKVLNVSLYCKNELPSMLTLRVKALSDPVFPKHHIHPLPMATHKQSHLGQGRLTGWPRHLRYRFISNLEALQRVSQH